MANLMVVQLDNHRFGSGPGTVISHVASAREFFDAFTDRDGSRDPRLRLWEGDFPIETRIVMKKLVCGTGKGIFEEVK
jgi:hypothetical protein